VAGGGAGGCGPRTMERRLEEAWAVVACGQRNRRLRRVTASGGRPSHAPMADGGEPLEEVGTAVAEGGTTAVTG
jgi:hypothetical protein